MKNLRIRLLLLWLLPAVATQAQTTNTFPANGKVGIGTTSPLEKLHVYRDSASYVNPLMVLEDDQTTGLTQMAFRGTSRTYHLGVGNGSTTLFGTANKFYLFDANANTTRFVVDANGNMAIGTATPANRLSISSATANTSGLQLVRLTSSSPTGTANGKVLTVDGAGTVILVNDDAGALTTWSSVGNSGTSSSTNFLGTTDLQDIVFKTNNVERGRLLANGNHLFGTGTDNGRKLQVFGGSYFSSTVCIGTDSAADTNYNLFVSKGIKTRKVRVDVDAWADYVFDDDYKLASLKEVDAYIQKNKHLPGILSAEEVAASGVDLGANQVDLLKKVEELTLYLIEHEKQLSALKTLTEKQEKVIDQLLKQLEERK